MEVIKVIGDKILIEWYSFSENYVSGKVIIKERYVRNIGYNTGRVLSVGEKVKDIEINDIVFYSVGSYYTKFKLNYDDEKELIIIPRSDIMAVVQNDKD